MRETCKILTSLHWKPMLTHQSMRESPRTTTVAIIHFFLRNCSKPINQYWKILSSNIVRTRKITSMISWCDYISQQNYKIIDHNMTTNNIAWYDYSHISQTFSSTVHPSTISSYFSHVVILTREVISMHIKIFKYLGGDLKLTQLRLIQKYQNINTANRSMHIAFKHI